MNTVWIVLPVLTLLMFELGLTLKMSDFKLFIKRPKPVVAGIIGQIILLPAIAFALAYAFNPGALFFVGVILIACSPGGSSSNVFSMIAKGDTALSVSLTALSSIITFFTIPVIMQWATEIAGAAGGVAIKLPTGNLIMQNIALTIVPIVTGIAIRATRPLLAAKMDRVLSKIAFPALMLLAALFFLQHHTTIIANIGRLGSCITCLIIIAMAGGVLISKIFGLNVREQRTLVIEIGMQNAAQSIAIASSPFIFNNGTIAVPAIIYALMMNLILLTYVAVTRFRSK